MALQPSSEGSRVPCAPVPVAIMNGRAALPEGAALKGPLHLHPTRERTASPACSLSRGMFLCFKLQIQNCVENISGADPRQGNPLNRTDPGWFWPSLPSHCWAPRAGFGSSPWHRVCSGCGWQHTVAHHTDPPPNHACRVTVRTPFPWEAECLSV